MYSKTFKGSHYIQFSSRRCIYVLGKAHYITYICTPPHFVSFLNIAFETVPMFIRLMMTLLSFQNSRKTMEHCFLFPCLSPPGDSSVWCPWHCVPAGSVSSSSTLQIFWDASHLWWMLYLPVYLLSHFPSLQHVQGSTSTVVLKGRGWPLTYIPVWASHYYSSLFVANSLNLRGWRHCGLTVTSWGKPVEGMGDYFHLHCQAGGWDVQAALSSWMVVTHCLTMKPHCTDYISTWTHCTNYSFICKFSGVVLIAKFCVNIAFLGVPYAF